jgi:hypothetical protein
MRGTLRLVITVGAIIAALAASGAALASSIDESAMSQLEDISHQLGDLQKKLTELQSKGQLAKTGKLSAAADCGFGSASQVFSPWGDPADYSLIPQGDLSDTSEWDFKNVTVSNEQDPVTNGAGSLLFTKGDSEAVTPVMCVNIDHPTLRLFLADRGGNGKAHLDVKVIYEGLDGHDHDLTLARLKVGPMWEPSLVIPIGVNLLSVASASGWTPVAFEFDVHGLQKGETFSLGGVYVDPNRSR